MSLSNYAENAVLKHVFGETAFTQPDIWVGLSKADPGEDGTGISEPANGYSRVNATSWSTAASRAISNSAEITFPEMTASDGTATHFIVMDASTGGNMLAYGALTASKSLDSGINPKFDIGDFEINFAAGAFSTYLANALLDHIFGNTAYTQPTIYVGAATATILDSDGGADVSEPVGNGYTRKACSAWDAVVDGATENTNMVSFDTATGAWGTLTDLFLADSVTVGAGNILMYGTMTTTRNINTGDDFQISAGEFDVSLT